MKNRPIFVGIFLCFLNVSRIYGVNIRIYKDFNLKGPFWNTNDGTSCHNINLNDSPIRPQLGSISTDTCMIVYTYSNCQGYWSKKYLPSSNGYNFPRKWYIGSYRACNNEEGGPQLNVDIMNYFPIYTVQSPATLQRYRNVCSCVNIPDYVQKLVKWSLNNHNNEMIVYSEPNCLETTWKSRRIPAGLDVDSTEMNQYTKAKSFGPDPNSAYYRASCVPQLLQLKQQKELLRQKLLTQHKINRLSNVG